MKVVLAFDKFKGSATSRQLNEAALHAISDRVGVNVTCIPVADGGDGTCDVLASAQPGQWVTMAAPGPLLDTANAQYFLCDDGTAIIEVAAASGLALLPPDGRDVMRATTLGTGMMMRDAMERGSRHIVLGLGGSATCDAGMGILCALGAEFTDANSRHLYPSGASLGKIVHIESLGIPQTVKDCRYTLLTDVDNPLCGKQGSARIYAPQKGASPEQVEQLEQGMCHIARIVGEEIATKAGCGAAGGIPALMMHLLDCELVAGAPYILSRNGLADALEQADLVITGEGQLDSQTLMGKGPGVVLEMARARKIPVIAVSGRIEAGFDPISHGFSCAVVVSEGLKPDEAMDTAGTLMRVGQSVYEAVSKYIEDPSSFSASTGN